MSENIDELRNWADKIAKNPEAVYDMTIEELQAQQKWQNPLGNITGTEELYVNMSLINWRDLYLRRLHMTTLVGFVYQLSEEFEPEADIAHKKQLHREKCNELRKKTDARAKTKTNIVDQEAIDACELKIKKMTEAHEAELKLMTTTARGIVKQFLNRHFEYSPVNHIRSSHSENSSDSERKPKAEAIAQVCKNVELAAEIDQKLSGKPEQTYKYLRGKLLGTYQAAVDITATLKSVLGVMLDPHTDTEDKQGILIKKYKYMTDLTKDLKKIAEPISSAETLSAWKVNPPVDVSYQFDRYLTNHYEQLREVVAALYNEKADFEYAVIPHSVHDHEDDAKDYRQQHVNEFRTEIITVQTNRVNLIGPFKENRQRVDYYNRNTEIMKRMQDQVESDHKLGADFMKKQRTNAKAKNIEEAGPDSPELANYTRVQNQVRELGAQSGLTLEEQRKLADAQSEARRIKENYEVPDDSVRLDMFYTEIDENGERVMKKKHMFTQAEAPLHLQEDSPYADKYQPVRDQNEPISYSTKTVVSRTGEKKTVGEIGAKIKTKKPLAKEFKGKTGTAKTTDRDEAIARMTEQAEGLHQ